ncbi:MurR/RpiR family transcriptional regulator [Mangrovicoccus algicola]|uniref:MurR/RpiR family transcriptional regulator n=1 Tax=Mangrovicoccus algicola TaxID=2771008 RepID=A0A8J7CTH1_9RHOB|nr:MurR/RpiR family transcriptional regulator [Mangrovicoccus algicola]MBE3636854.1 MurR/RpiR family transcriptional regulator [Mangrovicoccus algicola]
MAEGLQAGAAPKSIEAFRARLQEIAPALPRRMRDCAGYLDANAERIAVSTVAQLAEGAGVAPSAMMRFCQLLGFSGFSEMQRMFRDAYSPGLPDYATRLALLREEGRDSPSALLAEFVESGRNSLESLAVSIEPAALEAAVRVLAGAGVIHLAGMRRAYPAAAYLAYAFEKMQIPAMLHDQTGRLDHRHAMRPGDALLVITFAPYTPETVALAEQAAAAGLPVVAVTDRADGPFARPGILPLLVTEADFGAFRALSATISLAIALAVAVGARRNSA